MRAVLAFVLVALCASALAVVISDPAAFCTVSQTFPVDCQVAIQTKQLNGEYCGWCNTATEAAHWYYCPNGISTCYVDEATYPTCHEPVEIVEIGEACATDPQDNVCAEPFYNTLCLVSQTPQVCGGVSILQSGEECAAQDTYQTDAACRYGGKCGPGGRCGSLATGASGCSASTPGYNATTDYCLPSDYCKTSSNVNGTCTARLAAQADCTDEPAGCDFNAVCNSVTKKCTVFVSVAAGGDCDTNQECQEGLYCNNKKCAAESYEDDCLANFKNPANACNDDSACVCNWNKGTAQCAGAATSLKSYAAYMTCAATNNVDPAANMFPDTDLADACYGPWSTTERDTLKGKVTSGLKGSETSAAAALVPLFAALVAAIALLF